MKDRGSAAEEEVKRLLARVKELEDKNKSIVNQLQASESLYLKMLDTLPINIFLEDQEGHTIYVNRHTCEMQGVSMEKLIGKTVFDFFPHEIAEINRSTDLEVWEKRELITKEVLVDFQGEEHHMLTGKTILHIPESNRDYLLGFGYDITDRVRAEIALKESEEKFRKVIEQAVDSIFLIGQDGIILDANSAATHLLCYSGKEYIGKKTTKLFRDLEKQFHRLQESKPQNFEDILITKEGSQIPVDINLQLISLGEQYVYLAMCRDVREKKRVEEQIQHMAYHDALTNLPNRWFIQTQLKHFLDSEKETILGVILLDLDNFKLINDSLGHNAGDRVLQMVSERLQTVSNNSNTILARFGGDEFILLVPGLDSEEDIFSICNKINHVLEAPFYIKHQKLSLSASIGVSLYPRDGHDLNTLIKHADLAMYRSKDQGRGCYNTYHPFMKKDVINRMDMEMQMKDALEKEEFILYYQPKVNFQTGEIYGVEALVRWQSSDGKILFPDTFIPIAEETGLIIPLGEWVLREACRQCKVWHDQGYTNLSVSVNLSPKQFQSEQLVNVIDRILKETNLPPNALELELTEGMIMKYPQEAVLMLKDLKQIGIVISIDDFGTGFSSLSYLKHFPIDILKIDKSFIMNLEKDQASATIAAAVISLAQNLRLQVVAEGVENEQQFHYLHQRNCNYGQGYYIGKPLPASHLHGMFVQHVNI